MVQDIGDRRADMVVLAGQTVDRATLQGLKSASTKSGVSFRYLLAKAAQESSLNPDAQAPSSSASGLFQFTRGTWLDMVKRYGSQYGFADLSRQILETPSGKLTVTDAAAEKRILALRQDPETSGLMAAEYARDNAAALEGALGHVPDASDLYLAHFLGASGAATLLSAASTSPSRDAADLVPAAAKANPAVFTTPDGDPRSAADVVNLVRARFDTQMKRYAAADTVVSDAAPAAAVATPAFAPSSTPLPSGTFGKLDIQRALAGNTAGQSPANLMMLDQLVHMIVSDPMHPADEDDEDADKDKDPFRPLKSTGLRGSDWADLIGRNLTPTATPPTNPAAPLQAAPGADAARAYDAANGGPPRTLDDVI